MLTLEQIKALKPGDKVAMTYVPHNRKRPVTSVYLFDKIFDNEILLVPRVGSAIRFAYRLWDERLSLLTYSHD